MIGFFGWADDASGVLYDSPTAGFEFTETLKRRMFRVGAMGL